MTPGMTRGLTRGHTPDDLRRRIDELNPWFHDLDLNGLHTASDHFLWGYPGSKWRQFEHLVPADLSGKSVLDIGCNAGFYSAEMARRGAKRVLGIESDDRYLAQARLAGEVWGLTNVEYRRCDVYDVGSLAERFDVVLFMGVLYHLRHPLLALDRIHEHVAGDVLYVQSLMRGSDAIEPVADDYDFYDPAAPFDAPGYPTLHFIEKRYAGDPTNWWVPNRACVEAMLRGSGFAIEAHAAEVYRCRRVEGQGFAGV